jgi:hypothetical protein
MTAAARKEIAEAIKAVAAAGRRRIAKAAEEQPFPPVYKGTYAIRHLRESEEVFSRFARYMLRIAQDDWLTAKKRYTTSTGVRVRSKAERDVANALTALGIKYYYEPLLDFGVFFRTPDFYLPGLDVIIEHFGVSKEDDRYRESMARKKALYARHRIRWIYTTGEDMDDIVAALKRKLQPFMKTQDL